MRAPCATTTRLPCCMYIETKFAIRESYRIIAAKKKNGVTIHQDGDLTLSVTCLSTQRELNRSLNSMSQTCLELSGWRLVSCETPCRYNRIRSCAPTDDFVHKHVYRSECVVFIQEHIVKHQEHAGVGGEIQRTGDRDVARYALNRCNVRHQRLQAHQFVVGMRRFNVVFLFIFNEDWIKRDRSRRCARWEFSGTADFSDGSGASFYRNGPGSCRQSAASQSHLKCNGSHSEIPSKATHNRYPEKIVVVNDWCRPVSVMRANHQCGNGQETRQQSKNNTENEGSRRTKLP